MKQTFIDRMVATVAPGQALKRVEARARMQLLAHMNLGGELAEVNALDSRNAPPAAGFGGRRIFGAIAGSARADTVPFLRSERAASRDLTRTSPIACGAIQTNIDRVVGTGLALSAQPTLKVLKWTEEKALEWKSQVHNEFSLWADSPESDIAQTLNFYQQQALVLRAALESGDCFTNLPDGDPTATQPYRLRIQVLEADRIGNPLNQFDTPTISGGVRMDANGAPQSYHVYDVHPGAGLVVGASTLYAGAWIDRIGRTGRRRILHHYRKLRPEMPRGVPYLSPIIDALKQISRYTESEIMAAVVTSYFTVFIETPGGTGAPIYDGETVVAGPGGPEIAMSPGAVVGLNPGEKVTVADPGRPNPNFGPFVEAVITQIGMALGLPRELLIKQFNASYSASKAALLDAWVYFRSVRTWLALSFCQPIFETWLAEAVAVGRISAPGFFADPLMRWAYTRAAWPGDSMGSIDPKKEVEAYVAAIDGALMTHERAEWELFGSDFNDTLDTKASERKRLTAADLLPRPKAGAAAPLPPADPQTDDPTGDAPAQILEETT